MPELPEDSDRQTLAALGAAGVDDSTATAGLHANEEAVRTSAADFRSLVGTFHDRSGPRGLLMRCCRAVVDAVAFVRLFVHYRARCSCLVFGKPMITPKTPPSVNVARLDTLSATRVTVRRETVDNRPPGALRHVQSGGSHKNFSTT